MKWRWKGDLLIEPMEPGMLERDVSRLSPQVLPRVVEIQVVDGRAYVLTEAHHTRMYWFLMELDGIRSPGAPNGAEWVQVSLGGNVNPKTRNTEHIHKDITYLAPSYVDEKFPGYGKLDYEAMGFFFLPFLVRLFEMRPLDGAETG